MKKNKNSKKGNNKVLLVLLGILILCFIVIGVGFYKYFYAGTGGTKYGDRLDGIEDYPLSETLEEDIKKLYTDQSAVGNITTDVKGRIIYIIIDFDENIKVATAKDLAIKALEPIGEENLTFYEVQFILTSSYEKDAETKSFPVFGSKSQASLKVVW